MSFFFAAGAFEKEFPALGCLFWSITVCALLVPEIALIYRFAKSRSRWLSLWITFGCVFNSAAPFCSVYVGDRFGSQLIAGDLASYFLSCAYSYACTFAFVSVVATLSREKRCPALRRGRLFSSVILALVFAITYFIDFFLPALSVVTQPADHLLQICEIAAFSSVSLGLAQAFADASLSKAEEEREGGREVPTMKSEVQIETSIKIVESDDPGVPEARIEETVCVSTNNGNEQEVNVQVKEIVEASIGR